MMKCQLVGVRVDNGLFDKIKYAAAAERRTVSQYVRNLLEDAVADVTLPPPIIVPDGFDMRPGAINRVEP